MKARTRQRMRIRHSRANHGVKPTLKKTRIKLKTGTKK